MDEKIRYNGNLPDGVKEQKFSSQWDFEDWVEENRLELEEDYEISYGRNWNEDEAHWWRWCSERFDLRHGEE